jgi:cytochrome c peroxidase
MRHLCRSASLALPVTVVAILLASLILPGCSSAPEKKDVSATPAGQKTPPPSAAAGSEAPSGNSTDKGAKLGQQPTVAAIAEANTNQEPTPPSTPASSAEKEAESKGKPLTAANAVPLGLPPLEVPDDNPMTSEKVELGKLLYFDKRVSKDGTVSCATCHDPKLAWAEHTPVSDGISHQKGGRNAPSVINAAYATSQFWDGRAGSLEEQATGPVENPIEMGHTMDAVVAAFSKIDEYQQRFQRVFGTGVTKEGFAKAIAAFERTVLSGDSPFDRFVAGDPNAMTEAQKHGWDLFRKNCSYCHTPPLFSSYKFFNAGVGMNKPVPDEGRKKITGKPGDMGKFRVPALRNIADTAPYFHDGSAATLEDAVALMTAGGNDNPQLSEMLKSVRDSKLSDKDRQDLVGFLKALSGKYPSIEPPALHK